MDHCLVKIMLCHKLDCNYILAFIYMYVHIPGVISILPSFMMFGSPQLYTIRNFNPSVPQLVYFVGRLSAHGRVRYVRFHCSISHVE